MSYKYHERAIVTNERNLIRMFDVAFDGYNGGMGCDIMQWTTPGISEFRRDTESLDGPYRGKSMVVLAFPTIRIKDAFMSTQIKAKAAPGNEPQENPALDNKRLDLERIMRKLSTGNPSGWKRTERFLHVVLLENKDVFTTLKRIMNMRTADGDGDDDLKDYETWCELPSAQATAQLRLQVQYQAEGLDPKDITTPTALRKLIAKEISELYFIQDCVCNNMKALFLLCIVDIIVKFVSGVSDSSSFMAMATHMTLKEDINREIVRGDVSYDQARTLSVKVRSMANIDCECIMKSLFHSGNDDYFDWLDYFYNLNAPSMNVVGEIPNPLILPLMCSDCASQVFVDSENTIPIADTPKYELKRFLMQNMTHNIYSLNSGEDLVYQKYTEQLESMFNAQVNIQPGENIRSNTTQIPTLCYHGNMKVKQKSVVLQDIKCTGHMGNSYPGMASVREGRGVQTMTMPAQIMHVQ
jgi:hypothetical protein